MERRPESKDIADYWRNEVRVRKEHTNWNEWPNRSAACRPLDIVGTGPLLLLLLYSRLPPPGTAITRKPPPPTKQLI